MKKKKRKEKETSKREKKIVEMKEMRSEDRPRGGNFEGT
jgi:hypothetical protein